MCLTKEFPLILTLCIFSLVMGQGVPSTPCPDIFQYSHQPNGDVVGKITIPYDGSTSLVMGVNASMKGYFSGRAGLDIKLDTAGLDLIQQRAKILRYTVNFPFQHSIPKITHIQLNNRGYCDGPPEPVIPGEPGVTSMWSEHKYYFQTDGGGSDFPPPISSNFPEDSFEDIGQPITPHQRYPEIIFPTHAPTSPPSLATKAPTRAPPPAPTPPPSRPTKNTNTPATKPTISPNQPKGCGVTKDFFTPLIFGGTKITDGMFPWLAAMFITQGNSYEYRCTANLISKNHVVTAGRCVRFYQLETAKAEEVLFVFGRRNVEDWDIKGAITRGASKIQTNPEYDQLSGHGDLSVITLDRPVKYSDTISPICLWSGSNDLDDIVGKTGTVAGWGSDEGAQAAGKFSVSEAKSIEVPVVSKDVCLSSNFSYYALTSDETFCAGRKDGTGACFGDNGAAFMISRRGIYYLRGLSSVTIKGNDEKCDLSFYMIFADVAKFTLWIETSMNE